VFYLKALFGTDVATAILESPPYNITKSVCIVFHYQISSPKIELSFLASTTVRPEFSVYNKWTFANQSTTGSWNNDFVPLPNGVTKWRFVAVKSGMTTDSQYAALDHIEVVDSCVNSNSSISGMYLH